MRKPNLGAQLSGAAILSISKTGNHQYKKTCVYVGY